MSQHRMALVKSRKLAFPRIAIVYPTGDDKAVCCHCNSEFPFTDRHSQSGEDPMKYACSEVCARENGWFKKLEPVIHVKEQEEDLLDVVPVVVEAAPSSSKAKTFCPTCNGPARGRGFVHTSDCSAADKLASDRKLKIKQKAKKK